MQKLYFKIKPFKINCRVWQNLQGRWLKPHNLFWTAFNIYNNLPLRTSTTSSMFVVMRLTWLNPATVDIGTYWSASICETRYESLAKFSLQNMGAGNVRIKANLDSYGFLHLTESNQGFGFWVSKDILVK